MPIYQKALGDTARKARCRAKLSQTELAEMLDIVLHTVVDIENCHSNLIMETLYPMVTALHINPADILYPDHANVTSDAAANSAAKPTIYSEESIL